MEDFKATLHTIVEGLEKLGKDAPAEDAEVYNCPLCRDTGYVLRGDRAWPCVCRSSSLLREKKAAAGLTARLQMMDFDSFDLHCYPDYLKNDDGKSYRDIASEAMQNARSLADSCAAGKTGRGLLLMGKVGCGKTHLAAATANRVLDQGGEALFLVVPEFLDQLRFSYRRENEGLDEAEIISRTYNVPLLVLDDLGAHNYSDWVCNKLFTIINHRYNRNLPSVITTNLDLRDLEDKIGDRSTSRIVEMCRISNILVPEGQDHRLGTLV
ncbi:MAG: ATP-binding protein [Firmicutes bacterium]|nr:ATP-binding protein [Bacillota bacterium]